jgi:hypothetical protein
LFKNNSNWFQEKRRAIPRNLAPVPLSLALFVAGPIREALIRCQAEIGDSGTIGCVPNFGIRSQTADQYYPVD